MTSEGSRERFRPGNNKAVPGGHWYKLSSECEYEDNRLSVHDDLVGDRAKVRSMLETGQSVESVAVMPRGIREAGTGGGR